MEYKDFLNRLSSPARSALKYEGIDDFVKTGSTQQKRTAFHSRNWS